MNYLQRKRLVLMRSQTLKGVIRTVSGYPLTLTDCIEGELLDYKIHGNCIQDGTPTPDNPIEIQCLGDKTANIFQITAEFPQTINGVTFTLENGKIICNGTATANITLSIGSLYLEPGVSYYAKACPSGGSTSTYRAFFDYLGGENGAGATVHTVSSRVRSTVKIMIFKDYTCENLTYSPIISIGGWTAFEPYGYRLPVTVRSDDNIGIYNIYLDEPLSGIEGNSDYIEIDCSHRVATRTSNIRKILLDGRYSIGSVYGKYTNTVRIALNRSYMGAYPAILSSKVLADKLQYIQTFSMDAETIFVHPSIATLPYISLKKDRFGYEEGDSDAVIQQKMQNYITENPIEMYYQLQTPVTTDITNQINWNDIPMLYEGTNIISSGTTVPPSDMEASYYAE